MEPHNPKMGKKTTHDCSEDSELDTARTLRLGYTAKPNNHVSTPKKNRNMVKNIRVTWRLSKPLCKYLITSLGASLTPPNTHGQ